MCANWLDKSVPDPLLQRLAALAQVSDGRVQFQNTFEAHDHRAVLLNSVAMHPEVPEEERRRLTHNAIVKVLCTGRVTADAVLSEATRLENDFLSKPKASYVLVGLLSIDSAELLRPRRLTEVRLTFHAALAKRFELSSVSDRIDYFFLRKARPAGYMTFRAAAMGRSALDAGARASRAIELQRCIWNFLINLRLGAKFVSGAPQPTNEILQGPVSTLHDSSGQVADNLLWLDFAYVEGKRPFKLLREPKLESNERWLTRTLSRHPYREVLTDALRRYNSACDSTTYHIAFVEMWSILETLTATIGRKYEVLVNRIKFLYADVELHHAVLEHLRRYRNNIVHHAQASDDSGDHLQMIRRYVQDVIFYHLWNKSQATTVVAACELLDLPCDPTALRKRRALINQAIRLRGSAKKTRL